jgi:AmmeMemoRadiSam system protein B/AmmeMemoRadiSam system protein A
MLEQDNRQVGVLDTLRGDGREQVPVLRRRSTGSLEGRNVKIYASTVTFMIFLAAAAVAGLAGSGVKGNEMDKSIRRPAVAGQFYTSDPGALRAEIERLIDAADPQAFEGDVLALISPHAGYVYSGQTAAHGYSLLEKGQFKTVVVISPCHVEHFRFSSIYDGDAYETPLGQVEIDKELSSEIASRSDLVRIAREGHGTGPGGRGEHSLEVQIPFLQVALGDFRIVPVVMGDQSPDVVRALGEALAESLAGRKALIVASTDLSHFHDDASARKLDGEFMRNLEAFDAEGLMSSIASGRTEACGGGPSAAAMAAAAALGGSGCTILDYSNSGDVSGDRGSVVGYVSAVITGAGAGTSSRGREGSIGNDIDRDTRIFLLRYARSVISGNLGIDMEEPERPRDPVLDENRGGFVTLKKDGRLRGCIGYIEAVKPLLDTIGEMALSAAFRDHRFEPVGKEEIDGIAIEISVLSPVREVEDPSVIEVGRHGIIISGGGRRGLLLPQVAVEYGWDRETFLDQTCVKAGLSPGAWKDAGTTIEIFSAEIFSEEDLGLR